MRLLRCIRDNFAYGWRLIRYPGVEFGHRLLIFAVPVAISLQGSWISWFIVLVGWSWLAQVILGSIMQRGVRTHSERDFEEFIKAMQDAAGIIEVRSFDLDDFISWAEANDVPPQAVAQFMWRD